jgi:hypothetical protein
MSTAADKQIAAAKAVNTLNTTARVDPSSHVDHAS